MDRVPAALIPVRPAATVMLVRDGESGLEVFMLRRARSASFAGGQYVFPGGVVDRLDHAEWFDPICDGDDDGVSARLGMEQGGLAWVVAAIRECFEEAGVLLARPVDGDDPVRFENAAIMARFARARREIHDGDRGLDDLCRQEDLRLLVDRVHFVDHWITPLGEPKRFDTRFFLAAAPDGQDPLHDDIETIDSRWVRPADAIEAWRARQLEMFPPTVACLRNLLPFATAAAAVAAAAAAGIPAPTLPRVVRDDEGRFAGVKLPDDDGYDDLTDPEFVVRPRR